MTFFVSLHDRSRWLGALLALVLCLHTAPGAYAQPPVLLDLFASVAEAASGQSVSYSLVVKGTDAAPITAVATITLADDVWIVAADGDANTSCVTSDQTVQCDLLVSDSGTTITVQAQVAATVVAGTLLQANASITLDDGTTVYADAVTIVVVGAESAIPHTPTDSVADATATPEPTATATPWATTSTRVLPPTRTPSATATPTLVATATAFPPIPSGAPSDATVTPDALENNWSPAAAAPIAVGVPYDLNFTCPITGGCAGGDFDYLRVTVKAGTRYLLATYDLGPGVDTLLELYWGDETVPIAGNDDLRPSSSFLSALRWMAPSDGEALVRIGPRTGGLKPVVAAPAAGTYRFAIELADSPAGQSLAERIAQQAFVPTATSVPTYVGAESSSNDAPYVPVLSPPPPTPIAAAATANPVTQNVAKGIAAVVVASSTLQLRPDVSSAVIATLPQETLVSLLGESSGLWVRVSTTNDVLPGWVRATELQRVTALLPTPVAPGATWPLSATAAVSNTTVVAITATVPSAMPTVSLPEVTRLDPLPPPAAAPAPPRVSRAVQVQVLRGSATKPTRSTRTATPSREQAVAGLRVQLITALGDVLAEAVTAPDGTVTLTRDVDAAMALLVRVPTLGIDTPLPSLDSPPAPQDAAQHITITVPGGATP